MAYTTLIDVDALAALGDAIALFDCSFDLADTAAGGRRFAERHIPGAAYLHLDEDLSGRPTGTNGRHPLPIADVLARRLAAAGVRRGQQIVAYDDAGGPYAARLWWMAKWLGHEEVAVLDGGVQAWQAAGLPLVSGEAAPREAGDFAAGAMPGRAIVGADDILRSLDDHSLLVIDARTAARFRGEPDPLDPVAGHIPGARNRFYRDNLTAGGRFKPCEALASEFADVIGDTPLDRVALQCGSGVTAAHDLLAMEHAGLIGARLYPGSWSEWTSDPVRPIEQGEAVTRL
jgi:thiosulfate/3-mercaptopyruvate sulfurtransferase